MTQTPPSEQRTDNMTDNRDKEFPLFPLLDEAGQKEAQDLVDVFKDKMKKVAEEVLGDLYCDVLVNIESDSWTNYRNKLMAGFRNYGNRHVQGKYDFAEIRREIFSQFKEDIIKDLNQDLLEKVAELEKSLEREREISRRRY